ncbi:hypothetical protein [Lawsonia intracellularis]|uniref:hypothetical protein n=1 Tax=Lawsonia intracellularis TaxID=29546 RepID=UPI0021E5D6FB|nr:hypothetical protein [Lawsonia intracellularis]UYH53595.1 hypothetical protein OCT60_06965 [Lawsonia intracellularis]
MPSSYLSGLSKFFPFPEKRNDSFCVFITAIAIALLSTFLFYTSQSFELMAFPDRIHGGGIFNGHNAFKRPTLYFTLLGIFFIIFSCIVSLLSIIIQQFTDLYKRDVILFEKHTLISVSSILIISIPMVLINEPLYEIQYDLFKALTLGVFLIVTLRWLLCINERYTISEKLRLTPAAFGFFFLFSGIYLSSKALRYRLDGLLNTRMGYLHNILYFFLLGWIVSILDKKHRFLKSCTPLLLLPLTFIIASETQYILLTHGYEVSLQSILFYFTIVLCAITVFLFLTTKKHISISYNKVMKYWYFPLCIITLTVFMLWQPSLNIDDDLLHPANSFEPAQQLIQFGKIPFVDTWITRGLRDSLPCTLFMLLAGEQHTVDSFIWFQVFSYLTYLIILYCTFTKIVRPAYAFFLTFFFAQVLVEYSGWYNSLMLLPLIFLPWAMRNITFIRSACIWLLAATVFIWMPSAGKSTILGLWLVFFIKGLQDIKVIFRKVIPAFFTVFGMLGVIYISFLLLKDGNVLDRITEIHGVTCLEYGAHAYEAITKPSLTVVWYYIVTPLFFASICWLFIWRSLSLQSISSIHWMYLGMATSMLFLFTRSIGRHCLLENAYLMVFTFILIGLLPLIRPFKQRIYLPAWLFIPAIIILLTYNNFVFISPEALKIPLVSWNKETLERVTYTDNYKPVIQFLQQKLKEKETFIELLNGHGLYTYTHKKNPFYLPNISLYATDNAQKVLVKNLEQQFNEGKIPLAIVASPFWGGCIDGMPSTANHYRIAEFIYKHYVPYRNILGFEIWAAKGSRFEKEALPILQSPAEVMIPINAKGTYYGKNSNITVTDNILSINYGPYLPMVSPSVINMMTATNMDPIDISSYKVCTFELELTNVVPGWLQIFFSFDNQPYTERYSCKMLIPTYTEKTTVTLDHVLPNNVKKLTDIQLIFPDYTFINLSSFKLQLFKEYLIQPLCVSQTHNVKCGAHLWANYDPYHAAYNKSLVTLLNNVTLKPNETHYVSIPQYKTDQHAEYLSFRITSPSGGQIKGTIKDKNNHSGIFFFTLKKNTEPEDYLIRVSNQYAWKNKKDFSFTSHSQEDIHIEYINILEGD